MSDLPAAKVLMRYIALILVMAGEGGPAGDEQGRGAVWHAGGERGRDCNVRRSMPAESDLRGLPEQSPLRMTRSVMSGWRSCVFFGGGDVWARTSRHELRPSVSRSCQGVGGCRSPVDEIALTRRGGRKENEGGAGKATKGWKETAPGVKKQHKVRWCDSYKCTFFGGGS